ncbi:MAG: hypothetical protein ABI661_08020 [Gammaproteobacteria bacterium]
MMLLMATLGPLASAPALAANGQGSGWLSWLISLFGGGHHGGDQGSGGGSTTNLPGPGVLGLVVFGLGGTLLVARRRKQSVAVKALAE